MPRFSVWNTRRGPLRIGWGAPARRDVDLPYRVYAALPGATSRSPTRSVIRAWRKRTVDGVFASIGRVLVAFARFPRITKANVGAMDPL